MPDTKDWTWVLARPCSECGFVAADVAPADVPASVREAGERFAAAMSRPDVRERPAPDVWSPLEYTCHVRDVCRVMRSRIELILSGDGSTPVTFADWDQDATAVTGKYWRSDPSVVARQVDEAADAAAGAFERPQDDQWSWPALRSNGSVFTAATLGQYFVHDLHHHLWDIGA
jgi:hypothetical protein